MLPFLFAAALLSASPSEPPRLAAPAAGPALHVSAPRVQHPAPLHGAATRSARALPPDAPAARPHSLLRGRAWTPSAPGAARSLRGALFFVQGRGVPLRALAPGVEALTHAAAARERFEDARTQLLTSAGLGVAGFLTTGALRLLGAPLPRLPEVLGLRVAPLQALPLSFSVQGSLP